MYVKVYGVSSKSTHTQQLTGIVMLMASRCYTRMHLPYKMAAAIARNDFIAAVGPQHNMNCV